ncbi:ABC transporter substrate-binding protein [Pelagibacterales bacterium SAG-MED30]|nr:ABC transporter substrate-binding protein [Pelagibacterales bacterium SAG-MED30]|tara:strand:- start:1843 stop:2997 length:1155 start_codon:yes stop_codon:yes gene_type:complete
MIKIFKILFFLVFSFILINGQAYSQENKIKIGLLIPLTGDNSKLGKQILNSTRLAIKDINSNQIEIYPKDTNSDPNKALQSAIKLEQMGINIVIGPVFYENIIYLDEVKNITFLSLTNKTLQVPKNVVSAGINSTSQLNTIKKFIELNEIKKTIFLIPNLNYDLEIKNGIKDSKIKTHKEYFYDIEPTKLTKQIEKITNYEFRKQNLYDEITRLEKSDDINKEKKIENLKKRYTMGNLDFDSIIIADFKESLKSVVTSLLYTDVSPKEKYFITFNQWFDESLLSETISQPIYYPSINKENLIDFELKFQKQFSQIPNHLSLLSYDLVGLIYYLSIKNELSEINKSFKKKNSFKGKIGIFEIENNKINHRLNFYKVDNGVLKEIF